MLLSSKLPDIDRIGFQAGEDAAEQSLCLVSRLGPG